MRCELRASSCALRATSYGLGLGIRELGIEYTFAQRAKAQCVGFLREARSA